MDVSRYIDTTELKFEVEFITPTFLGGADGNAELRTAPFKNLIRRWWRIANGHLAPEELWKKESDLFGSTEKNPDIVAENRVRKSSEKETEIFGKSKVRVNILDTSNCSITTQKKLNFPDQKIEHPEVHRRIEVETYLGMGPVFWNKNLKRQEYKVNYIQPGSKIDMSLFIPKNERENIIYVLSLIKYFGTIGSRSRNGWGSININPKENTAGTKFELVKLKDIELIDYTNIFNEKSKAYPHGIGKNQKGILCWETPLRTTWQECMKDLAGTYLDIRMAFKFTKTDKQKLEARHLLGYPVTHHGASIWDKEESKKINTRLPSQLILKVIRKGTNFSGLILHIPNLIPLKGFTPKEQKDIWKFIHDKLDHNKLKRFENISGGTK